jgi:arsenate reductase (glutaredoxin)
VILDLKNDLPRRLKYHRDAGDAPGGTHRQSIQGLVRAQRGALQGKGMTDVTIYHNPSCGTSRNVLALIRNAGVEPRVIEYLKSPPDRATLESLLERMNMKPRALLREKGTPYAELGLADEALSDAQLIDAMLAHPVLINRPIVVTPRGVKLCRPSEVVLDILTSPQKSPFAKEDGERVIDDHGNRIHK